ncbi:elongation factor EF-2 [Candidatus Micrarchaeota archaeon RBG_16_49_10]|nr:MAG: elongation factor EF-2 [Candidatus Micrarchaeota archaeon RBG_16_49_10]
MAKEMIDRIKELMYKPEKIRNISTVAHIDHGKTTFSDSLVAGAGMISEHLAGQQRFLDFDDQEQERGITIWSANITMVHDYEGDDYLINLIDTPGHVDFGGDVTRALRAVDGAIVLIDAVEKIMPQTETVLRQALKERAKPVLFINKVDRLIKELKLTPEQIQERFMKIITEVNLLIQKYAEPDYRDKWLVNVSDGSVAFGSALKKWGTSVPFMKKVGITFKDIIDATENGTEDELAKKSPLHKVVLDMTINHLPSPKEAQRYRIPKIWSGDMESEIGKAMVNVDTSAKLAAIITKINPDPHAGFVCTARIFSGKIEKGKDVYLIGKQKPQRIQQVAVYKGAHRIQVEEVVAGNIVAIVGLNDAFSGETLCEPEHIIQPFEEIKHMFEPVVTKSMEPKNPQDLTKLITFLKKLAREDTTIKVKINEETGEYLISGLGELHLDAKVERKFKEMEMDVKMSPPIVVYRETVGKRSSVIEGKSPNKHNKFYFYIEPLDGPIYQAMKEERIPSNYDFKKKNQELQNTLVELGMEAKDIKKIQLIYEKNMLIDQTKGVQYLNEVMEMVKEGFKYMIDQGPLAKELCYAIKAILVDAELHEDPVHRGPGQILPAIRHGISDCMLHADPLLLEPKQIIRIDVPTELMGGAIKETQNRRGQILEMNEERGVTMIQAKIPVAEMFGFDSSLKSATGGKGFYSLIDVIFEKIPKDLQDQVVLNIRKRKGLSQTIPKSMEEEI